jgi:hypothetical protein
MNPYTKTPLIEKLYDLMVVNPQSLLRRWLPQIPLSPTDTNSIKVGKENTIPAETYVDYLATTKDLTDLSVTAGYGSQASMVFPHFGSLSNYMLGTQTTENYNLQRILRPKNFVGPPDVKLNCDTSLIDALKKAAPDTSACGICNSSFGQLARAIVSRAGELFNVPGAAIWATWLHEGGGWGAYGGFADDNSVYKWSLPVWCPDYQPMPSCNNDQDATVPPSGWIKYYFYDSDNGPWTAVQKFDPSRDSQDKVSRCNFIDAIFATAKTLNQGTSYRPLAATCLSECNGYTITNASPPGSCSAWSDNIFAQSQVSYAGYCPDISQPNCPGGASYPQISNFTKIAVGNFDKYSCH